MNKLWVWLISAFILVGCHTTPGPDVSSKGRPPVSALVKLGDNLDQAKLLLRSYGYNVTNKYHPSVIKDGWEITVDLDRAASIRSTLYDTFGTGPFLGNGRPCVVLLESGLDGKIRKIY